MKHILTAAAVIALTALPALADVTGTWKTHQNDDGDVLFVKIEPCGADFCGNVVDATGGSKGMIGKPILKGMKDDGNGAYSGGKIYVPSRDSWARGKLNLKSASVLEASGCILGRAVCRSFDWTRQ